MKGSAHASSGRSAYFAWNRGMVVKKSSVKKGSIMDQRLNTLAHNLVNYSVRVQPGENVYIEYIGHDTTDLARLLVKEVYQAGGRPYVHFNDPRVQREVILSCTADQLETMAELACEEMRRMNAYIGVRGPENTSELSDVPSEKLQMYNRDYLRKVVDIRVSDTKWVILRYPNASMAQSAGTSLEAFEDYYFNICNLDYSKMAKAMESLVDLMNRTDQVRITGPGTDLTFSIKEIPAVACAGECNIPDGEVYTAPIKDSVQGVLTYNTPSVQQGFTYENVKLIFKDGKIMQAEANDTTRINKIFDTDEGARYIGEFAIGVNPYITEPMKDILFDEKIMGSFHFTPGCCYDDAFNGNHSAVHWDLVCIQSPEFGGGEIYFDDVLIRKDGRFVLPELVCLNPENLK